ncbi:MAG: twitch domain-containing radical SAM protein [Verrucomicrobiota bacterium]
MGEEYHTTAGDMRDRLNAVSSSLCLAKWQQVSLHLPSGMTQSCYHPPTHKIPLESIKLNPSALHNTPTKIGERKLMLNGARPAGCSYCWKVEDAESDDPKGHLSDRHYRSSEWWAAPTFEEVTTSTFDYDVVPRYVEVNFNQACNFKCMYCSPHLSSAWEEEVRKHGGYPLQNLVHNDLEALERRGMMPMKVANKDNPYVQAFWQWWPTIYRKLRVFRMTGGEPLMDKNTFNVLDYVNENPHGQLELSITSNMCPPDQKLFTSFVDKVKALEVLRTYDDPENFNEFSGNYAYVDKGFKHFWLFVSLDGFGPQAEYIRDGLDFDRMLENVKIFLRETKHTSVSFINTFNLLSIPSLHKFLEMILELRREFGGRNQIEFDVAPDPSHGIVHKHYKQEKFQRVWFDLPILRYPPWFSIQNGGKYGNEEVSRCLKYMEEFVQGDDYAETFEGFKPYEILKVKRDLAIMQEPLSAEQLKVNKINFYLFINEYNKRRQRSFLDTFPELHAYWKECVRAHLAA